MEPPRKPARAAGSILAFTIIAGALIGIFLGQPSIGFLAGTALGALIAILLWLKDRG